MTDRELLEAAAEACGYQHKWNLDGLLIDATCGRWNPLTDDGDALRLAVKLGMTLYSTLGQSLAMSMAGPGGKDCVEMHAGSDPYAATRRAIVRAAAAMANR